MSSGIINSLIAASGVLIAAIISYLTGTRRAKTEIKKFKAEARKAYGSRIYEKRMEIYPEIYSFVSDYIKTLRYGKITNKNTTDMFNKLQAWDNKNAIFFSGHTHKVCSVVRHKFGSLSKRTNEELEEMFYLKKRYMLTKMSLTNLEAENDPKIPNDILENLQVLIDKEPIEKEKFTDLIQQTIGNQQTQQFISSIFNHAEPIAILKQKLQLIELSLKYELGIFAFETPLDDEEIILFETYSGAHIHSEKRKR